MLKPFWHVFDSLLQKSTKLKKYLLTCCNNNIMLKGGWSHYGWPDYQIYFYSGRRQYSTGAPGKLEEIRQTRGRICVHFRSSSLRINPGGGHSYLAPVLVSWLMFSWHCRKFHSSSSIGIIEYTGFGVFNSV